MCTLGFRVGSGGWGSGLRVWGHLQESHDMSYKGLGFRVTNLFASYNEWKLPRKIQWKRRPAMKWELGLQSPLMALGML